MLCDDVALVGAEASLPLDHLRNADTPLAVMPLGPEAFPWCRGCSPGPQMPPFPTDVAWLCHAVRSESGMRGRQLNLGAALRGVPHCALGSQCVPLMLWACGHTGVLGGQAKTHRKHLMGLSHTLTLTHSHTRSGVSFGSLRMSAWFSFSPTVSWRTH